MDTTANNILQKSKLLIKGLIIGGLVLLLLIPAIFVQNLIREREHRQKEAVAEVSGKWAGKQIITGPVLVLPYWKATTDVNKQVITVKDYAYFLPSRLNITSTVTPQEKHRGIYKVMLYTSSSKMEGTFEKVSLSLLNIAESSIIWNEAFVKFHVADVKGLNNEIKLNWNDTSLTLLPQSFGEDRSAGGLGSLLNVTSIADLQSVNFSTVIDLNGSERLLFTPVGKTTTVKLSSTWPHPSFTGNILPQQSDTNAKGFTANWTSLSHTRAYPQQWLGNAHSFRTFFPDEEMHSDVTVTAASFGMDLFVPVNGYQKTMRSVKYAILCILLTFTAFFLIETTNRKSVHPVQYALIGFALILFYTLLLSISEYTGFNIAYGIAALATIGLIGWFVKSLLGSFRLSMLLSFVLILLYSYVFTILQLQDYALLMGSIGLFLTLAVVMYFSRRIQW
ncbi:MAG TPA: cell envelope integrity protein CreD [Chitinophagaceae bacterium]